MENGLKKKKKSESKRVGPSRLSSIPSVPVKVYTYSCETAFINFGTKLIFVKKCLYHLLTCIMLCIYLYAFNFFLYQFFSKK